VPHPPKELSTLPLYDFIGPKTLPNDIFQLGLQRESERPQIPYFLPAVNRTPYESNIASLSQPSDIQETHELDSKSAFCDFDSMEEKERHRDITPDEFNDEFIEQIESSSSAPIINPLDASPNQWTSAMISTWIEHNPSGPFPAIDKILYVRRYNTGCCFEFCVQWKLHHILSLVEKPNELPAPPRTWIKYADLLQVPQYEDYLLQNKWNLMAESKKNWELNPYIQEDQGCLSDIEADIFPKDRDIAFAPDIETTVFFAGNKGWVKKMMAEKKQKKRNQSTDEESEHKQEGVGSDCEVGRK
jgi:hypothetical protein